MLLTAFVTLSYLLAVGAKAGSHSLSWDYVIVGGGTAGVALGSRLSENSEITVLIIEAGASGEFEPKINVPELRGSASGGIYDWNHTTIPQPGAMNRSIAWPRGRVLGGSSALNFEVWDRATKLEYDAWEQLGNTGWNWKTLLPYMMTSENWQGFSSSDYSGFTHTGSYFGEGGPVQTMVSSWIPRHQLAWIPTMLGLGIPLNLNSLNGHSIGVSWQPTDVRASNHTRSHAAPSYYYPAAVARRNLNVFLNTTALKVQTKVTLAGTVIATGVLVQYANGTRATLCAKREVILSAGSIQTPGLLELSGIGDPAILEPLGIKTLVNLPGVGSNLHDHIRINNVYELVPGFTSATELSWNATFATDQMSRYANRQRSIYDYTTSAYAFISLQQMVPELASNFSTLARKAVDNSQNAFDKERNEIFLSYITKHNDTVPQIELIFSDGASTFTNTTSGKQYFSIVACLEHPFARGSIHINTTSALDHPTIDPKYFDNDFDVLAVAQAVKYIRKIASTPPLSHIVASEFAPGPSVATDDDWIMFAKQFISTLYHPIGTAAMMPRRKNGVVDTSLKVYGTTNVRVVDASIIPIHNSAHPQTVVYAIAERAADIILSE